jgi:hypothetical protein
MQEQQARREPMGLMVRQERLARLARKESKASKARLVQREP